MKLEFFKHNIGNKDIKEVNNVLRSIFLTSSLMTKRFEDRFAKYLGSEKVVCVSNCTAALFLSLKAYNIGPGDEVITTPMTFIATPNSIIHSGAMPVFADVEENTGNINADLIEGAINSRTKAIIPVHLYGQMCDMKRIRDIADKHKLVVIEDAAHAIEARRDGVRVGELGDAACFSFYATKNITCGEGGAISINNEELAKKIIKLRLHGMDKAAADRYAKKYQHWDMEMLGWKYNMDDIHAALLLNQLKNINKYLERREEICRIYENAFADMKKIRLLKILPNSKSARHLFTILVPPGKRDGVMLRLHSKGIGIAVNYRPVHLMKYYRKIYGYKKGMFPVAENIGERTISLPLYPKLTRREINYIIKTVKKLLGN